MFHPAFLALPIAKIWQKHWATKLGSPKLGILDLKVVSRPGETPKMQ